MSEKDKDFDSDYDGIVPEHLRYIDEKEALDHKKQGIDDDIEIEKSNENDQEILEKLKQNARIVNNQTNYPPTLTPSRFTSKIPDDFICKVCENVVKEPLECRACENLICKACSLAVSACPFECGTYKFKQIAKFAANMYNSLTLDCKNKPFGCSFTGNIRNVLIHEENCSFVLIQCENMLCERYILKKEKNKTPGVPFLCSEVCENLLRFSILIDEDNMIETLQNFTTLSERCKKLIQCEVKLEMQNQYKKIDENKKEHELFKKRKERIEKEIQSWQNSHHPGKWNLRTCKWTCCGSQEMVTIGCKFIS